MSPGTHAMCHAAAPADPDARRLGRAVRFPRGDPFVRNARVGAPSARRGDEAAAASPASVLLVRPRGTNAACSSPMLSSTPRMAAALAVLALSACAGPVDAADGDDAREAVSLGSRLAPFEPGFYDAADGSLYVRASGTTKSVWATWGGGLMAEGCGGELQLGTSIAWATGGDCELLLTKEGSGIRVAERGLYAMRAPGAVRGSFRNDRGFGLELQPSDGDPQRLAYVLTARGVTYRGDAVPGGRNVARAVNAYATLAAGCELDIVVVRSDGGWPKARVQRTRDALADRFAEAANVAACDALFGYATSAPVSEELVRR